MTQKEKAKEKERGIERDTDYDSLFLSHHFTTYFFRKSYRRDILAVVALPQL